MTKEVKLTTLDSKEIPRYTYDIENNAQRVIMVGSDFSGVEQAIKDQLKDIKIDVSASSAPIVIKEIEYREIQVPVVTTTVEVVEIEKPIYITETKVITVEKPILIQERVLEQIEVPVVVKEKEIVYVDKLNYKLLFIMQAITLGLIVVSKYL